MFGQPDSKQLAKQNITEEPDDLSLVNELYGQCLAEVFKEYAPHLSECYSVCECENRSNPTESVASFEISKLVLEKDDKVIEKLKNVYHLLAYSGNSIAIIINRSHRDCQLHVAVGTETNDSEKVRNLAMNVRDAFLGNFPGSDCGPVRYFSDGEGSAFGALNESLRFGNVSYSSVGIVSNVATNFGEEFSTQGIEKLIDGISLKQDEEYTIMLVGKAVPHDELVMKKDRLCSLYTSLSPFASVQKSWGTQESTTWTKSVNLGIFGSIPKGPVMPSVGFGLSKGDTVGTNTNDMVTITEYGVKHMLDTIEKQMQRLESCEALGLWQFSAYVMSPDARLVSEASHMYLSLTQGDESYLESPAINLWNAHANGGKDKEQISRLREYLVHLEHPNFAKNEKADSTRFNQHNWPNLVSCTAELSGSELTNAINIPRRSIPGLPVIECAPFGREISSYDRSETGDIRIGCIHHMHHDEEMTVDLSSKSLQSHVFITGSTGCGKSNTVYRLLDEADANFLVIEPAKGEYKYEFAGLANVYGTNPLMGELLGVNPFVFPSQIHIYEHIDRILEVFNVCWPMYAAMPAVLKEAVIRAYEKVGWDLKGSRNELGEFFPTFKDVCKEIDDYIESSDYSADTRGDYKGSLKTRLDSLANGINELVFCNGCTPDEDLFDSKTIVDLSRVGSSENKALIMGILVIKLQEHRMSQRDGATNEGLRHITVIEEAHNLLRNCAASSSPEMGGGIAAKSVEMISNAIAEMRTYGEAFVIVDQAPSLMDMAAIRNTSTKIIMRLPDEGDRMLVGKAANLNESQIQELAKLQRGVAAIYQNEWIEPVLCHIEPHERGLEYSPTQSKHSAKDKVSSEELRYLNSCVLNPFKLDEPREYNFCDCVHKMDIPDSMKARLIEMARTPLSSRKPLFEWCAYRYFNIGRILDDARDLSADSLKERLCSHLLSSWKFEDDSSPESWGPIQYLFIQSMLNAHLNELRKRGTGIETTEKASALAEVSAVLSQTRPVI